MFEFDKILFATVFSALLCLSSAQCQQGQAQLSSGSCIETQYIEGCLIYSDKSKCSACQFNYDIVSDRCNYNPKDQSRCCETFGSNGECNKCKTGLFLQGGACKQATIVGCLAKNGANCLNCASGFYLRNGRCQTGVKSCTAYTNDGKCTACKADHKLDNGVCIKFAIQGCEVFSGSTCTKCYSPFSLSNGACIISNCDAYDDFGCVDCADGFFLKDRICSAHIKGCQVDARGVCAYCNDGLALVNDACVPEGCSSFNPSSGECQGCAAPLSLINKRCQIQNCLVHRNGTCVGCQLGYRYRKGQCVSVPGEQQQVCRVCAAQFFLGKDQLCSPFQPGCLEYGSGVCSRCSAPFELIDNNCVIDGCVKASRQGCVSCAAPYSLDQSSRICRLQFCLRSKNGRCLSCQSGYNLSSNGLCVISDPNCNQVNALGVCTTCNNGFHVEPSGCVVNQPGCIYSGSVCSSCISPFKHFNGRCEIDGCTSLGPTGCIICIPLWYLSGNICKGSSPGCIYENGRCVKCKQGFNLEGDRCTIEGCDQYYAAACKTCASPYVLFAKICKIPNCLSTKSRRCVGCAQGFSLTSAGSCIKTINNCVDYATDRCKTCGAGYYLSATGNDCLVAAPGCIYLNGECNSCQSGYYFQNKRCFENDVNCVTNGNNGVCLNCKQTFYVDQNTGKCRQGDLQCLQFNLNGSCKQCNQRYFVNDKGGCSQSAPGCVYSNGRCTSCSSPFVLDNGACQIPGCDNFNFDGCLSCASPFFLSNNICRLRNCALFQGSRCTRCDANYLLSSGQCILNDGTCTILSPEGICLTCKRGYALIEGRCVFADDNCISFNSLGKCQECDTNYFLNGDAVCKKKAVGCATYSNEACATCIARYFLWEGICFPYVEGCLNVVGKDCVQCDSKYDLSSGICVKKMNSWTMPAFDTSSFFSFQPTPGVAPSTLSSKNFAKVSEIPSVKLEYSSVFNSSYTNPGIAQTNIFGWKAQTNTTGAWIGYLLPTAQTFYKVIIQASKLGEFVKKFVVAFRVKITDNFQEIPTTYDSSALGTLAPSEFLTIDFATPVKAIQIRIIIKEYVGWPALRFDFLYNNVQQTMEWSGIRNINEINKRIMATATSRLDTLMERNGRFYMVPSSLNSCKQNKSTCYAKASFCDQKVVSGMRNRLTGSIKAIKIEYSIDGVAGFVGYNRGRQIPYANVITFNPTFTAKEVRVTLFDYSDDAKLDFSFDTADISK